MIVRDAATEYYQKVLPIHRQNSKGYTKAQILCRRSSRPVHVLLTRELNVKHVKLQLLVSQAPQSVHVQRRNIARKLLVIKTRDYQ